MSFSPTRSPEPSDLDAVWREHADEVLTRCFVWMGGHADDAQEAFSRAWARAAANLIEHRPELADPRAWLLTLAYRVCMDLHRERARRAEETLESGHGPNAAKTPHAAARDPERVILGNELVGFLQRSIEELPPRLRDTMRIYMASGEYRDVVEQFGITEANARKRIQQARAILRTRLLEYRAGRAPAPRRTSRGAAALGAVRAVRARTVRTPSGTEVETAMWLTSAPASAMRMIDAGDVDGAIRQLASVRRWVDLAALLEACGRGRQLDALVARAGETVCDPAVRSVIAGIAAESSGDMDEAETLYREAHRAAPNAPRPLLHMAHILLQCGRVSDGLAALDATLRCDANDVAALTLGYAELYLAGRVREREERNRRALELDPLHAIVLRRRALGSLPVVEELTKTRPLLVDAWVERARLLDRLGRSDAAMEVIESAERFAFLDRPASLLAIRIATRTRRRAAAITRVAAALDRWGGIWETLATVAWALHRLGARIDEALDLSTEAGALEPELAAAAIEHGRILLAAGRIDRAAQELERARTLLPPNDGQPLAAAVASTLGQLREARDGLDLRRVTTRMIAEEAE